MQLSKRRSLSRERLRTLGGRCLFYAVLLAFAVVVAIPLIWVLGNALRPNAEIGQYTLLSLHTFVPARFTFENFVNIFSELNMVRVILNTVFVAITVTFSSLVVNSLAAYAFARIRFFAKGFLFVLIVSLLVLPIEILIIPLYLTIAQTGLKNTFWSLILPFIATPFGIFYMRQFYLNTPRTLDEAALLDGCGHGSIFFKIYLPLAKTPLITLGLLAFLQQWDSFIVPVTFIDVESRMLLQVALTRLAIGLYANDYGILFAGVALSIVPMMILYFCFQKYIVESVASTGIKG